MSFTRIIAFAAACAAFPATTMSAADPVRIGVLQSPGSRHGSLARGSRQAVAEMAALAEPGTAPLELVLVPASRSWQDGGSLLARLIVERHLRALVGPTDAAGAHLAAQIATKLRLPIIALSPEAGLTQAKDPWLFSGVPTDREQARMLLRWTFADPRGKTVIVAIPGGRAGRLRLASIRQACRDAGARIIKVIASAGSAARAAAAGTRSARGGDLLLLWLDPEPALELLNILGAGGVPTHLAGSLRLDDERFAGRAPAWVEGLAIPLLRGAGSRAVDLDSAVAHDMVKAIGQAVRTSGAQAAAIRAGLAAGAFPGGRSGDFTFDPRGRRVGPIPVGVLRDGRWVRDTARK